MCVLCVSASSDANMVIFFKQTPLCKINVDPYTKRIMQQIFIKFMFNTDYVCKPPPVDCTTHTPHVDPLCKHARLAKKYSSV